MAVQLGALTSVRRSPLIYLGLLLVALALVALLLPLVPALRPAAPGPVSIGSLLATAAPGLLEGWRAGLGDGSAAMIWTPFAWLVGLPFWLVVMVPAIVLLILGASRGR